MRAARSVSCVLVGLLSIAGPAAAQRFEGRVYDDESGQPAAAALVRLLDESLEPIALSVADDGGQYRIEAPGPGRYHLAAERIGFDSFTSHLLSVEDPEGAYTVDIALRAVPLPISGFVVTAERFREIERAIQLQTGAVVASMRFRPFMRPQIEEHMAKAHDLEDMMRWAALPGVVVRHGTEGPCIYARNSSCLDVYVNGVRLDRAFIPILPLDMMETVVIVASGESIVYPAGAILVFTRAWLR